MHRADGIGESGFGFGTVCLGCQQGNRQVAFIIQGIKNTHDAHARFNCLLDKGDHQVIRVGLVGKEILPAQERLDFPRTAQDTGIGFQPLPGVFI